MVRLVALLSICLLSREAAVAQGTYLFTWHGDSNFFQATFSVTQAEMQPGASFNSSVFYDSISVASISGVSYYYATSGSAMGDASPFALSIDLLNLSHGTEVHLGAGSDFTGIADEKPFSGPHLYTELGYWSYQYVPEPSTSALLCLGTAVWFLRTRTATSRREALLSKRE
jgi:hypothetical protein